MATIENVACAMGFFFGFIYAADIHVTECEALEVSNANYASASGLYLLQKDLQCNDPSDLVYMKENGRRYIYPMYRGWTLSSTYCVLGGYYRADWMLFPWSAPWSIGGVEVRCLNHSVYLHRDEPAEGVFELGNLVDRDQSTAARFVSPLVADLPLLLAVRSFNPFWRSSIEVYVTGMNSTCHDSSGFVSIANEQLLQVSILQNSNYDFCPTMGKSSYFCGKFSLCTIDPRVSGGDLMFQCPCDGDCDVVNILLYPSFLTLTGRMLCTYTIHEIDIYQ